MGDAKETSAFAVAVEGHVRERLLQGDRSARRDPRSWTVFEVASQQRENDNWDLVILFHDVRHPGCTFGFRFADLGNWRNLVSEPQSMANICVANLEESVEAGDSGFDELECEPGRTVWV